MSQGKALAEIERALKIIDGLLGKEPNYDRELLQIKSWIIEVRDGAKAAWPMEDTRLARDLKVYALRNIDDMWPELSEAIYSFNKHIVGRWKNK